MAGGAGGLEISSVCPPTRRIRSRTGRRQDLAFPWIPAEFDGDVVGQVVKRHGHGAWNSLLDRVAQQAHGNPYCHSLEFLQFWLELFEELAEEAASLARRRGGPFLRRPSRHIDSRGRL